MANNHRRKLYVLALLFVLMEPISALAVGPTLPAEEACKVSPRTAEEITILQSGPEVQPIAESWDGAIPATSAEIDAITATFVEFTACYNSGRFLNAAALLTDDAVASNVFALPRITGEPVEVPAELKVSVLGVFAAFKFSDGRIGAIAAIDSLAAPSPVESQFYLFRLDGDRWRIEAPPVSGHIESN